MEVTSMILVIVLISVIHVTPVRCFGIFTNQGNLEKLYLMEEEIMSLTDAFLRQEFFKHEGEDPHNFTHIVKFSDRCKQIRRESQGIFVYLKHPINVFHLVRRMHEQWPNALERILGSEPCQKWKVKELNMRLENIRHNIPTEKDVFVTAASLVVIRQTTGTPMEEFTKGKINGHDSLEPLTLSDMVLLGRGAYDEGYYEPARDMLAHVQRVCSEHKSSRDASDAACVSKKNFALIAQAYGKMGQFEKAVEALDELLKIDPQYTLAKMNRKYFLSRMKKSDTTTVKKHINWRVKYTTTCSGERKKTALQNSQLRCRYFPTIHEFVFVKAEWLHNRPPVVVFHDLIPNHNVRALKNSGWAKTQYIAHDDLYATPNFAAVIHGTRSANLFNDTINRLKGPIVPPLIAGDVEVRNYGMQGLYFKSIPLKKLFKKDVASYFLELPSEFEGGEYVLPKYKVKTQLQPGSVLFLFASKSIVNICPVTYGTKWAALQSLAVVKTKFCRIHENW
ncbi:prolyl 4-hydroxylase subunit alpha-1-like [Gigantopelta aegis]|uniref:prolyl 4-hydroxylase subunit alpha-1-like n=1 Tax=Gigantopelta aegis TaxID=1735272 RepID=UPI001B88749F|nr:prolyl 4-hydroxylase subunit alpha-1-like [Gigantopelta aegis]